MTIMTKPGAILKIKLLQNSSAASYFETSERLFLQNILTELESESSIEDILNEDQINKIQKIFLKYEKYL